MKSFKELHLGEEAVGGLSAGIIGTVIGFPLDLAKTRMQTGSSSGGLISTLKGVIHEEGLKGLYKGIGPPLISLSILNVTTFTQYAYFRELYNANPGWDSRNFAAGASCAPVSGIVSTVENLIKTQMMLDNVKSKQIGGMPPEYRSSWNCFTTLIRNYGIGIVYTGHGINTIRECVFIGPYFFLYEGLRQTLVANLQKEQKQNGSHNNIEWGIKVAIPMAGGLAGASSWFLSFPLDLVRSRVQGQSLPPAKGAWQLALELVQDRGFFALYTGSSASIARAFLVSGSRFSAYEASLWLLRGGRNYEKHHD